MSLTICLLYFLKVNHHFNFALGYPWKLQIEFFIIGSDNIFSFVFSHLQNTSAIINNTTSSQFGFKNSKKNSKMPQNRCGHWNFLFDLVTLTCSVFKGNKINKPIQSISLRKKVIFKIEIVDLWEELEWNETDGWASKTFRNKWWVTLVSFILALHLLNICYWHCCCNQ